MLESVTSSIDRNNREESPRKLNNFDGVVEDGERRKRLADNNNFAIAASLFVVPRSSNEYQMRRIK